MSTRTKLAEKLSTVILPDDHTIAQCWNPIIHGEPFKGGSARIFEHWYRSQGYCDLSSFKRAAPLCVFHCAYFSHYVFNEQARGTYAVCPKCSSVISHAWPDDDEECEECGAELLPNDYFQPIFERSRMTERELVDPERDPAVLATEICSLVANGISVIDLSMVALVLSSEGLLTTADYVNDYVANGRYVVESASLRLGVSSIIWPRSHWITADFRHVAVTERGKFMLNARGIQQKNGAVARALELCEMDHNKLSALALRALADRLDQEI